MAQVSVIIPVYNTEKYLPKCLDSVCNQTLKDIEIICVNDCSPDNSLVILQEYAKNDNRIKLINFTENKGAAAARNAGIDAATGEYIGFVDSDDFVDLDFYEKLYTKAKETDADAVKGDIIDIFLNKQQVPLHLNLKIKKNKFYFNSCFTTAIYRQSLLKQHKISFLDNCIWGEDRLFPVKVAFFSNKLGFVDDAIYFYERRDTSATFSKFNTDKMLSALNSAHAIIDFLSGIDVSDYDYNIIYTEFLKDVVTLMVSNDCESVSVLQKLQDYLQKYKLKKLNYFVKEVSQYIEKNDFKGLKKNYSMILRRVDQLNLISLKCRGDLNA